MRIQSALGAFILYTLYFIHKGHESVSEEHVSTLAACASRLCLTLVPHPCAAGRSLFPIESFRRCHCTKYKV